MRLGHEVLRRKWRLIVLRHHCIAKVLGWHCLKNLRWICLYEVPESKMIEHCLVEFSVQHINKLLITSEFLDL